MEPQFQSSFIPKKPIATQAKPGYVPGTRSGVGFFTLITIVIFLMTLLFSGGVYAYRLSLQGQIDNQIKQLEKAREQFEPNFIAEATRLNARMIAAREILRNHISPSTIFSLLEENTLKTVQFTDFSFADNPDGTVAVTANGIADSFRSIVLQSDTFGDTTYMRNVLFTGLQPTQSGNVSFGMTANLDSQFILFSTGLQAVTDDGVPAVESIENDDVTNDTQ